MNFGTAIVTGFQKYSDFTGKASRSEFWWFQLFLVLVSLGASAVLATAGICLGVSGGSSLFRELGPQIARCRFSLGAGFSCPDSRNWHCGFDRPLDSAHQARSYLVGLRDFRLS